MIKKYKVVLINKETFKNHQSNAILSSQEWLPVKQEAQRVLKIK